METGVDNFEAEIKQAFLDEAGQLLVEADQLFLKLESDVAGADALDPILRVAHNLKGSAQAVGFRELGDLAHAFEAFVLKLRESGRFREPDAVDLMLACNDRLKDWVMALRMDPAFRLEDPELEARMRDFDSTGIAAQTAVATASRAQRQQPRLPDSAPDTLRVSVARLEGLLNDVGELVILQAVLKQQKHLVESPLLQRTIEELAKVTRSIQGTSMKLRMVSLERLFGKLNRALRDASRSVGKPIELAMSGEETEIDRRIVDQLSDPLVHLIRNAVDHGIEPEAERLAAGKPPSGTVGISAYRQGGRFVIEVRDDGRGLDPARLRAKAVEKGLVPDGSALTEKESIDLIFMAGFSTKVVATEVSGRGVGMDVVKTNIEFLKGEIEVDSVPGQGTCFRLKLPLTLAIIDGLVVRLASGDRFVIPLSQIDELVEVGKDQVERPGRSQELLRLRDEAIPLYRLDGIVVRDRPVCKGGPKAVAVICRDTRGRRAFLVESILGQQQVVIKQLGKDLGELPGVSGSAILGDGRPALILDLEQLMKRRAA